MNNQRCNFIRNRGKFVAVIGVTFSCLAASALNAAAIPAGTTLSVSTASSVTSQDPVGRTFAAQLDQDVSVNGRAVVRAGTKAFEKITASRANPRKNTPLSLELTSVSVDGRNVAVKTDAIQPEAPVTTARQGRRGHTVGSFTLRPGSKLQFRLAQAVTL